ncbi:MAG: hypothetical protein ACI9SY_000169 [Candidatus Paceibacteria bacterium]
MFFVCIKTLSLGAEFFYVSSNVLFGGNDMSTCAKLEQLVARKTFDSIDHLRGAIRQVVGDEVFFDQFGPVRNGIVPIVRKPCGDEWSCDLQARITLHIS